MSTIIPPVPLDCPCAGIPAMTPHEVHDFLRELGQSWSGLGGVVELGCWLGASTRSLLEGLLERGYDRPYHCHDAWEATLDQVNLAAASGVVLRTGQSLLPLFLENLANRGRHVVSHRGKIEDTLAEHDHSPLEICLLDAPKTDPLFARCMAELEPRFIAGRTMLGLLDYNFWQKYPGDARYLAPVQYIEPRAAQYKCIATWPGLCSCAFFRYLGPRR